MGGYLGRSVIRPSHLISTRLISYRMHSLLPVMTFLLFGFSIVVDVVAVGLRLM